MRAHVEYKIDLWTQWLKYHKHIYHCEAKALIPDSVYNQRYDKYETTPGCNCLEEGVPTKPKWAYCREEEDENTPYYCVLEQHRLSVKTLEE